MSETVRKLKGKLEIIYGKEEDVYGVNYTCFNGDGTVGTSINAGMSDTLKSLNVSDIEVPVFELDKHTLRRRSRVFDKNRILLGNADTQKNNRLDVTFVKPRKTESWSLAGVRYKYLDKTGFIDVYELPTEFTIALFAENAATPFISRKFSYSVSGGLIYYSETNLLNGAVKQQAVKTDNEEVIMNFDVGNILTKKVSITINKWHIFKKLNGSMITSDDPVKDSSGFQYGKDKWIKLSKCFDNKIELYDGHSLQSFEITKQLSDSEGDIKYGIVSNTLKATILNENRKLDVGYLKDKVSMGKRAVPYITENGKEHRLGTFYISSWSIPMDNSWVNIEANDKLFDLHDIMYPGFFPEEYTDTDGTKKFKSVSMYDIVLSVIDCINDNFFNDLFNRHVDHDDLRHIIDALSASVINVDTDVNSKTNAKRLSEIKTHLQQRWSGDGVKKEKKIYEGVDLAYLDMIVENPYLERQPIWDVLENIAKSTMSFIYLDNKERLIFVSDLNDRKYNIIDGNLYREEANGSRKSFTKNTNYNVYNTVTASNAYEISKPKFRKAFATEVATSYSTYKFDEEPSGEPKNIITYYIIDEPIYETKTESVTNADGTVLQVEYDYYRFFIPRFLKTLNKKCSSIIFSDILPKKENNKTFFEGRVKSSLKNTTDWKEAYFTIQGKEISKSSTEVSGRTYDNLENKDYLSYECGTLVNVDEKAKTIIDRLIELYKKGREMFECDWIGDLNLDINSPIQFTLPHDATPNKKYVFRINSLNTIFDGGLEQKIKAISYLK